MVSRDVRENGLECVGLDISRELIDFVRERAARNGVRLDLRLGNIEETALDRGLSTSSSPSRSSSTSRTAQGLANVAASLSPGGVLHLCSTNRFSPWSGEFSEAAPLRLAPEPDPVLAPSDPGRPGRDASRHRLPPVHVWDCPAGAAGDGISRVYDIADLLDPERLNQPTGGRSRCCVRCVVPHRETHHATFWPATELVAVSEVHRHRWIRDGSPLRHP